MTPVINVGDVVIVKETSIEDVKVGDIAAFYTDINNDGTDDVVVHYIDMITTTDDEKTFKTKPEVSDSQDDWVLEEDDIIGIYEFQINNVGSFLLFLQSWPGRIFIIVDVVIILYIIDYFEKNKKQKKTEIE